MFLIYQLKVKVGKQPSWLQFEVYFCFSVFRMHAFREYMLAKKKAELVYDVNERYLCHTC